MTNPTFQMNHYLNNSMCLFLFILGGLAIAGLIYYPIITIIVLAVIGWIWWQLEKS